MGLESGEVGVMLFLIVWFGSSWLFQGLAFPLMKGGKWIALTLSDRSHLKNNVLKD